MPPRSAEEEIETWLATVRASGASRAATARATLVPPRADESVRRAESFLAQLAAHAPSFELRPGEVIGEGGMGIVREAEQVALKRIVAIKTAKPGRAEPTAARDLLSEAWMTGALEHPNIVPVHHLAIDDQRMPLLILKRVNGVEWSALFDDAAEVKRRFAASDLLAWNLGILDQVLNAVRFAHSLGVIHRDLKPSNVMIGQFGEVYLLDWGIAASLRDDGTGRFSLVSEANGLAGTPCYMAPEMLRRSGDPPLSERTDVYLAGAVLVELLAGHPPHLGESAIAVIANVVLSSPALPAEAPAELAQVCRKAMQPAPADRFESIDALQLAIRGYLDHRGSERLSSGAGPRLAELVALAGGRDPERREEIYRQLAICRFAFHEALSVWRDNAEARAGLTRASIAVAEYELACDDPRAAVTLLTELEERPALLDQAQAAAAAQADERRRLEHLGRDADPTMHGRTRNIVGALALALAVLPLAGTVWPRLSIQSYGQHIAGSASLFVVVLAVSWWLGRAPMTAINRLVFATVSFLFAGQTLLAIGASVLGTPPNHAQVLDLFLYATLSGMFALTKDRWIALVSASYFAGFLVAARFPADRFYAMSATNLVFAIFVLVYWRPSASQRAMKRPGPDGP